VIQGKRFQFCGEVSPAWDIVREGWCMPYRILRKSPVKSQEENGGRPTPAVAPPGFVLLDTDLNPLFVNDEAVGILTYPRTFGGTRSSDEFLVQRIQSIFSEVRSVSGSSFIVRIKSGKRLYLCSFFAMSRSSQGHHQTATALLLERNAGSANLLQMSDEFHFTQREREVVELLAQGMTSKEIASRMKISPNTVKAFLRLAMIKAGVTTRSGIIGRILRGA
jgi:DNA-binding CsgD family transcriptional regulator